MKIKRFIGGDLESNGYILYHKNGGECFIIDPGYNPEKFVKYIKKENLQPKAILLTHHHYDHTGGVPYLRDQLDLPAYIHFMDVNACRYDTDFEIENGDSFFLEEEEIKVINTPGHTEGSVCFFAPESKAIFTGDTLFDEDIGRTDLKDGDDGKMHSSCHELDKLLENDIVIYPGHGEFVTMKHVRTYNSEFIEYSGRK